MLNRDVLLSALKELSDKDRQEYYWRGFEKNVVCEPVEIYESLINGSKLSAIVKSGTEAFSDPEIGIRIMSLGEKFFNLIDRNEYDIERILADVEISDVRSEATEILQSF